MHQYYRHDLACIHDAGFGFLAEAAASDLLARLPPAGPLPNLIVELGCGTGILAERLSAAGYAVLGFDLSEAALKLARARAPDAEFRCASWYDAKIPPCAEVAAIGEVFCYQFDRRASGAALRPLFRRLYRALTPGGLLLCDVAGPGRVVGGRNRSFVSTDDWACLVEAEEADDHRWLERRIITFRRAAGGDDSFRRDEEVHRLRLYPRREFVGLLRDVGFRVKVLSSYGDFRFPPGWYAVAARKPSR